jgi:YtfJ family uncharacterized protein
MLRQLLILFILVTPAALSRAEIALGAPLPPLAIEDRGELLYEDGKFKYVPWQLPTGTDKPHVLQYMAGTLRARDQTRPFTDALEEHIPSKKIHVTSVVNLDAAMWGSSGFVISKLKSNKEKYPDSTIVLDEDGVGQKAWSLSPKEAAIVVLDAGGSVLYFNEGAMSDADIEETLGLIRQHLEP